MGFHNCQVYLVINKRDWVSAKSLANKNTGILLNAPKYTVQSSWHVTGHMSTYSRDNDVCTLRKTNIFFSHCRWGQTEKALLWKFLRSFCHMFLWMQFQVQNSDQWCGRQMNLSFKPKKSGKQEIFCQIFRKVGSYPRTKPPSPTLWMLQHSSYITRWSLIHVMPGVW